MTTITANILAPSPTGTVPAKGYMVWTPTRRRLVDDGIILPSPFTVSLIDGKASFTAHATTAEWVWRVDEVFDHQPRTTRYVTVHGDTATYKDLSAVNPETLEPWQEPSAIWWETANNTIQDAALSGDELLFTRYNGEQVNLGNVRGRAGDRGPRGFTGAPGTDGADGLDGGSNELTAQHITTDGPTKTALNATTAGAIAEVVYDVKLLGAKGDGTTDDTAAITSALASIPKPPNTFGAVAQRLHFPAGRYIISGSLVLPERMTFSGDGPYQTILHRKPNSAGDFVTLNGGNSIIRDLTLDGNRHNGTSGDVLVLNAAYTAAEAITVANSPANGITVGKAGSAILYRLDGLLVRDCLAHGIYVTPASGSTDGQWVNVDIGRSGLCGVKISNGAQNLVNVHSWGSGLEATTAKDGIGILLDSSNNALSNCQAESNWSHGIASWTGQRNSIVGGSSWGNRQNGIYIFDAEGGVLCGVKIYNNGVDNLEGTTADIYAGIRNQGGTRWTISGCYGDDDASIISTPSYTHAPTNPYPGRTATRTTAKHYVEVTGSQNPNWNSVTGNNWRSERTRNGVAVVPLGSTSTWAGNFLGGQGAAVVASASSITPPPHLNMIQVSGSATITSISATTPGRMLVLQFTGQAPVTDGGNLLLAGNYTPTAGDTLTLVSDGTNWHEIARSGDV